MEACEGGFQDPDLEAEYISSTNSSIISQNLVESPSKSVAVSVKKKNDNLVSEHTFPLSSEKTVQC